MAVKNYYQDHIEGSNYQSQGASNKSKLLMALLIIGVIFVVIFMANSIFGSSSSAGEVNVTKIITRQTEIRTILKDNSQYITSIDTANFAARTNALLASHTQELKGLTSAKVSTTKAATSNNIKSILQDAANTSEFDAALEEILEDLIRANLNDLEAIFDKTKNSNAKEILENAYADQFALIEDSDQDK